MARPLVSVLIDTYNHERFIEQAIASVLEQDFPASDREVLVVDDGSTDKSPEILRKFEPHIRVLRKANGGQASAFNAGIPKCQGEIVAFLDGDDWWTKDKLATIVPIFESQPDIGGVGHGCFMVDANGHLRSTTLPWGSRRLNARTAGAAREFALHACFFGTSKVAYRRSILQQILPIPEGVIIEADEWLFSLAPWLSEVLVLDRALFYYRLHGGNMFLTSDGSEKSLRRKYHSIACLAAHLPLKMRALGIPVDIETELLAFLRLQVDQLRLQLDGGWSWEVFQTETSLYRVLHADAPWRSKTFRWLSMIPALLLPPRSFYAFRRWLSSRYWYSRMRQTVIPVPPISLPKTPPQLPPSPNSRPEN